MREKRMQLTEIAEITSVCVCSGGIFENGTSQKHSNHVYMYRVELFLGHEITCQYQGLRYLAKLRHKMRPRHFS